MANLKEFFDHPALPINRSAVQAYLQEQEANEKREVWCKTKYSLSLLAAVGFGSFLFFTALFSVMPAD